MIYLKIFFLIIFPLLEAYRDFLSFPIKPEFSSHWHKLGFTIRGLVGILLILPFWQYIPLYAFYFWISFDLITGVGTTSDLDKLFGKRSIYWKVGGFIASIGLIIFTIWV